jgi:hypothetical protein
LHGYGDILKKTLKEYFKRKLLKKEIRTKEELREEKARKEASPALMKRTNLLHIV